MEIDLFLTVLLLFVFDGSLTAADSGVHQYQCSRTYLGRLGSGVISSYNYPFDYRDNLTCVYRIYLDNRLNGSQTVCLTFHRFSLENSSPFCSFDYVELGLSPPVKYCGTGLWQYGVEDKANIFSNIWSPNLCWATPNAETFDLVFSSDNTINGTGFYATFHVSSSSSVQGSSLGTANSQGPCSSTEWTCFSRKCIPIRHLCNGQNDCGDWSDESYAHARCKGQNILACDFTEESSSGGFCEFDQEGWTRSSEVKRSNGPPGDHTNGTSGHYIYSEGNSYLISSQLSLPTNSTYCLSFWYFVYGHSPSVALSVYASRDQAYSRPEWSCHVGSASQSHRWRMGEVVISQRPSLQVIFATQTSNNESGIALDDISVTQGSCAGVDISCNFESGMCGWQSVTQLDHSSGTLMADYLWRVQNHVTGSSGPNWDHSSNDGSGYFLHAHFLARTSHESKAMLVSRSLSTLPGDAMCLRFWYYLGKSSPSACLISVLLHHYDNVVSVDIWSQGGRGDDTWTLANVDFEADGPLQVILMASLTSQNSDADCEISVDQVQLVPGVCMSEEGTTCDTGEFRCFSNHCIDSQLVCDGTNHCRDGSDEDWRAGCFAAVESPSSSTLQTTSFVCRPSDSFLCHSSSYCIPRSWLCDLFNDCGDMSDEGPLAGCPGEAAASVPLADDDAVMKSALAKNASTSRLSTMAAASASVSFCEFTCGNGICLSLSKRCDGFVDCPSGQDEVNCSRPSVPPVIFCELPSLLCLNENLCLSSEQVCDGMFDCSDGSDEAVRLCSDKLSVGAVTGIVFGCCFSLLILLLLALLARRRRRRKQCVVRQPRQPSRPPARISTVFSVNNNNPGGISRHIDALSAFIARNGDTNQSRNRNRDNMGYIEEAHRETSGRVFPSEMQLIFGEAPPSYSSVLQDNGHQVDRRHTLVRGNSADELETVPSRTAQDNLVVSPDFEPPCGHSRNRRSYRSLPPTPAHQPLVSYYPASGDPDQDGPHPSMLGYGAATSHDASLLERHIYEDPSGGWRRVSRNSAQLASPLMVNIPHDISHQSTVISPTLSSQRASRIRLGTMALQNRSGTVHGHSVYGPVSSWHSGIGHDVVSPVASRQLCCNDPNSMEPNNCDDPSIAFALNELMSRGSTAEHLPGAHVIRPHNNNKMAHAPKSSVGRSATLQRNHSHAGHRASGGFSHLTNCYRNSTETSGDCYNLGPKEMTTDAGLSLSMQPKTPAYPHAVMDKRVAAAVAAAGGANSVGCILSGHRRSSSSNNCQSNQNSTKSVISSYQPGCDDIDFFSPTRV